MSAKMESRQCTPSVIARLMGFDELSSHQPVYKKQKVLSENYLRRVASVGARGKRSSHERQSFRLIAEEKKAFKDTFEVHGKVKKEHCNLPVEKRKVNFSLSEAKEVGDARWGVVDSKIDLFMKYLQEPDSLITDHLCNFQGIPYHLRSGCLTVLKPSNASDTGMTDICSVSGRETRKESDNLPTNIIVLKPKLGKKENAARCFPSCSTCLGCHSINNKHKEFPSPEKGYLYVEEKESTNVTKDVEPVGLRFRISGKFSGQTGQGKNLFMKVSKPGGRDSDTFAKESDLKTFISPNSCDGKNHQQPSFYHSDGLYEGTKARKEILERLETTIKFQEVEAVSESRTLGEMLALPDQESSPGNLHFRLGEHSHSGQTGLRGNLFLSSLESANRSQNRFRKQSHNQKEGSEYRNSGSSCMKSRSLPCLESTNSYSVQDDHALPGELNRKLEGKDTCEETNMVFKSLSSYTFFPDSERRSKIQEGRGVQKQQKEQLVEKDICQRSSLVTRSSVDSVASATMIDDVVTDAEAVVEGWSSENLKRQYSEKTDCMLLVEDGYFSSQVPYASTHQDMSIGIFKEDSGSSSISCTDLESLVNLEEAYQSSPNSVLEPPFEKEILSNYACFQGVDANLLETYSEGDGMIVSSDDDFEQGSVSNTGKSEQFIRTFSIEEGRDFSYLVDVFTEAGFHYRNSGTSYETWHSRECLISPAVFEMLEKKYGAHISWKRSERRLLFDRINSELMEIFQPIMGSLCTKPLSTRLCFGKSLDMIEEVLWMVLDHQKKQATKDSSGWLELGDNIELIVKEIEDSLIDQLAAEIVSM